jgi:hypothetical protein
MGECDYRRLLRKEFPKIKFKGLTKLPNNTYIEQLYGFMMECKENWGNNIFNQLRLVYVKPPNGGLYSRPLAWLYCNNECLCINVNECIFLKNYTVAEEMSRASFIRILYHEFDHYLCNRYFGRFWMHVTELTETFYNNNEKYIERDKRFRYPLRTFRFCSVSDILVLGEFRAELMSYYNTGLLDKKPQFHLNRGISSKEKEEYRTNLLNFAKELIELHKREEIRYNEKEGGIKCQKIPKNM